MNNEHDSLLFNVIMLMTNDASFLGHVYFVSPFVIFSNMFSMTSCKLYLDNASIYPCIA